MCHGSYEGPRSSTSLGTASSTGRSQKRSRIRIISCARVLSESWLEVKAAIHEQTQDAAEFPHAFGIEAWMQLDSFLRDASSNEG